MNIATIERFVTLAERSQLHKISVEDNGQSITVVNSTKGVKISSSDTAHINQPIDYLTADASANTDSTLQVCANNVGYLQLSPDGAVDDLVKQGDMIEIGQVIGFVNVLTKLLPIESQHTGVVDKILVTDGEAVEFGQPIIQLIN